MVTCLQTLSKVAKVKVLIHRYSLFLIHFFFCFLFLMFPILPPFSSPVKNISEYFKIFRKFFQDAFNSFRIISKICPLDKIEGFEDFYGIELY